MVRRHGDYVCMVFGILLMVFGTFTYLFPEIIYTSSKELPSGIGKKGSVEENVILIPRVVSIGLAVTGVLLLYTSLKIRKRGA